MGFFRIFSINDKIDQLKEMIFKVTWVEIYGATFIYYGVFQEKLWKTKNTLGKDAKLDLITAPHFLTSILSFNTTEIKFLIKQTPKFIEKIYVDHSKRIFDNNPIILNAIKDCIRDTNHISSLRLKIDNIFGIYEQKVVEVEKYFSVIDFNLTRLVKFYESTSADIPADLTSGISRLLLVAPFGGYLNSPTEEIDIKDVKEFKL